MQQRPAEHCSVSLDRFETTTGGADTMPVQEVEYVI
jgi:hypothetical protein